MGAGRLERALAAIDAVNAASPERIRARGEEGPKELLHAQLATAWIEELCPEPSEALRLAARAHHIERWSIPRSRYPEGRRGYHRWRRALHRLHAERSAEILRAEGYDEGTIGRVADLVQKAGLGKDEEVQHLEDALCLVFLETGLRELAERLEPEKLDDVLRKTLRKMSPAAIERAAKLPLAAEDLARLARAAAEPDAS